MPYAHPLTDTVLADALAQLPNWRHGGAAIVRTLEMADFRAAITLVNAVADAAELANHHPDIDPTVPTRDVHPDHARGEGDHAPRHRAGRRDRPPGG